MAFVTDRVAACPDAELKVTGRSMGLVIHIPPSAPDEEVMEMHVEAGTSKIHRSIRVALPEDVAREASNSLLLRVGYWDEKDEEELLKTERFHVFNSQRINTGRWDSFCVTCMKMLSEDEEYDKSEELELQHVEEFHGGSRFAMAE